MYLFLTSGTLSYWIIGQILLSDISEIKKNKQNRNTFFGRILSFTTFVKWCYACKCGIRNDICQWRKPHVDAGLE